MSKRRSIKELRDAYRFAHFTPSKTVHGIFGDPYAVVIRFTRRQKKRNVVVVVGGSPRAEKSGCGSSEIFLVAIAVCIWRQKFVELLALSAMP